MRALTPLPPQTATSPVRRVAVVQHQLVAVRVGEDRHVADPGVQGVAEEVHALGLEVGARRVDVLVGAHAEEVPCA
jgi:hypothetical protein